MLFRSVASLKRRNSLVDHRTCDVMSLRQTFGFSVINFWFPNNWRTLYSDDVFRRETKKDVKRYSCEDQAKKSQTSLTAGTSYISMHSLGTAEKKQLAAL